MSNLEFEQFILSILQMECKKKRLQAIMSDLLKQTDQKRDQTSMRRVEKKTTSSIQYTCKNVYEQP